MYQSAMIVHFVKVYGCPLILSNSATPHLSILSHVDTWPRSASKKTATVVPSFNHPSWQQLAHAGPRWRAPLSNKCVCFVQSFGCSLSLSLSQWGNVGLPLVLWQESGPNFKRLPKVSRVATNHWVFLNSNWSPISSLFYYRSQVKKNGIFPNLM